MDTPQAALIYQPVHANRHRAQIGCLAVGMDLISHKARYQLLPRWNLASVHSHTARLQEKHTFLSPLTKSTPQQGSGARLCPLPFYSSPLPPSH